MWLFILYTHLHTGQTEVTADSFFVLSKDLFPQDYTKRDGNFKSRPISLAAILVRFWKAETISYIRLAFLSLALPHGAYSRAASAQIRLERRNVRVLSTFFEMTNNVAAISTIGFTYCCCDQLALRHIKWACVFS